MASGVFDIIGPVMVGPSSSHTAGVVRIGNIARQLYGSQPDSVEVTFYNSFATTFKGHGSDRAAAAGILGLPTDDPNVREALVEAEKAGIVLAYKSIPNALHLHPNTIEFSLNGSAGEFTLMGESLGGGVVNVSSVNGYRAGFDGTLHTLMLTAKDIPGVIAFVTEVLSHDGCNIASMTVSRKQKAGTACHFIETDTPQRPQTLQYLHSLDMIEDIKTLGIRK